MPAFSTRVHGYLDLAIAAVLLTAPWWGGFAGGNLETAAAVVIALALVAYTLLTDHEIGRVRRIDMTTHLWIDALAGIVLASSPWVFSFDSRVWAPHLLLGLLLLALAIVSHTIPGYERRGAARTTAE
jgi:hypothetical protein